MKNKKASIFGGEQVLFLRLKRHKDKQAFIEAYDLYIDQIQRFVYFKLGNKDEAEDITSMVFLKCWNYVYEGNLESYDTLKPLLYKIARNTIIDHYRQTKNQDTVSLEAAEETVDEKQNVHDKVVTDIDFKSLVQEKLPLLKDEYRDIIILRFINELSVSEIAKVLGKTSGNVRVLAHRALQSLQEIINNEETEKNNSND
ncbi:MAG: RNA polymerase sigma factor [Candidatus Falkowbacteria bacterium]|nr:RNA polymerase sigma factor [Candidatus Falkowbacteria bacterium]